MYTKFAFNTFPHQYYQIHLATLKSGRLWTSSISIIWKLVWNTDSWVSLQTFQNLPLNKTHSSYVWTLKFEK